jgi:hypothetical protein
MLAQPMSAKTVAAIPARYQRTRLLTAPGTVSRAPGANERASGDGQRAALHETVQRTLASLGIDVEETRRLGECQFEPRHLGEFRPNADVQIVLPWICGDMRHR